LSEISRKRKFVGDDESENTELQPLNRGNELDNKVHVLINKLRNKGGNINWRTKFVKGLAKGVVIA
jgi:hypothetical protein